MSVTEMKDDTEGLGLDPMREQVCVLCEIHVAPLPGFTLVQEPKASGFCISMAQGPTLTHISVQWSTAEPGVSAIQYRLDNVVSIVSV
jgi:hypothetical protein